jgi:elongation factor 1-alpha
VVQRTYSVRGNRCNHTCHQSQLIRPLSLPIQDVYKISGIGTVPVGKIETGVLNTGKTVIFNPSQKSAEVKSIEMHHTMVDKAEPGDNVGFNVSGLAAVDIRSGDVSQDTSESEPPSSSDTTRPSLETSR